MNRSLHWWIPGALVLATLAGCDDGLLSSDPFEPSPPTIESSTAGSELALTVDNLVVSTGKAYRVATDGLAAGRARYIDRSYIFRDPIPAEVQGLTYIRTANGDKNAALGAASFLSFDVNESVVVYVAHDDRVPRPDWLVAGFSDTGLDVRDSDGASTTFSLFSAAFPAGTITLGSNAAAAQVSASMYSVIIEGTSAPPLVDTEAPTVPGELNATAVSSSRVDLIWSASADNVGVAGYGVYRGNTRVADVSGTSYRDTGLAPSTTYGYTVEAYDEAGNVSGRSQAASATTESDEGGSTLAVTGVVVASGRTYSVNTVGLAPGAVRYIDRSYVFRDPVPAALRGLVYIRTANADKNAALGQSSFLTFDVNVDVNVFVAHDDRIPRPAWLDAGFTDTGLDLHDSDGVSVAFSVFSARFPAGRITLGSNAESSHARASMYSVLIEGTGSPPPEDTEAPTVPTDLSAAAVSNSGIDLGWTASTDNVGVTGYYVYRNDTQVAHVSGAGYRDTGLRAATTYRYTVAAHDAAGNVSAKSSSASATTASGSDTEAPSVPTGLGATVVSSSRIALSWAASTDNVGVAGYRVYRDGVQVADGGGTGYVDIGLGPSTTYRYAVAAYDAAGNISGKSSIVSVTTDAGTTVPGAPYPGSSVIRGVTYDWSTHDRRAPGSDNWALTWAADGHQYTSWGDGGGFGGTQFLGRVSLGVARVEGSATAYTGTNINGGYEPESGNSTLSGKSYGMIALGGALYMWRSPGSDESNWDVVELYRSTDRGATWARLWEGWTESDGVGVPAILQFGRDNAGARDSYIYSYFINIKDPTILSIQTPGEIVLARVPRSQIENRSAYQWFAGLDAAGTPTWTSNLGGRVPVFEDDQGVGWNVSATYNPGLDRYLLITEHTQSRAGTFGIFDAPEPWGPWTTVAYETGWPSGGEVQQNSFYWNFSPKWWSGGGQDFVLVFTGNSTNDSWNSVEGSFILP